MSAFFKGRKRSKSKDRESELFDSNERSFGPEESSKKKSIFKFPTLRKKKDSKSEIQENVPVSPDGQPYGIEKTVMGSNVERSDTVKEAKRKAGFLSFLKRRSSDVVSPEREVKNFINERGQFVNERGILIDDRGRMINNRGQLINDLGQLINDQGQLINERGQLINDQGQLTNEQGQPIDEYGRLMTDQGRQLENYGRFTNNQGYQRNSRSRLIDNRGRLVNERGQLINELGQIIDEKGNILDPRIPENEPYTGEKGQLFNEKGQLVDSYGRLINERGQLIDGFGRPVNERGHLINNTGQLIDHNGRLINEKGQLINKKGQLINDKGQLVNEKGLLVDEKDRLINNRGQLINERGQFVNENGQLLNDYGQPVNDQGQLIDAYGEVLPVVTLLSDGDLKPISPKLRVKETDIDSDLHSSNISERPSSKNNEEQITPEKDIPAALYHKMLADTWSKTQPDPAQVRKIPKQMRGSTTSNQSSRLSENESVMNRNSDSLYDESHPSGIYRQNSGNQPGKSILRHHGRYEDGDIGMRHRPNRFESEGEADTEGFDESRGDLDPINSLPRRPLMPRRMGFPEKQPSRSHTNDTTPPVYIGDENQRPNEVDYTKFGLAAKLFADSIGPPPPIEKSKTMYMTMVNDIPEDVRWNRQSTSSEVFIPAKSRIPAEVLNAPRVELPEPDDNKLTPQWVIVRGRAVRRRKKKTRRGKTKIVTELDLAGRRIFFKVGSNWQDLAYSLFAQRQPEASTRRMIQEIRMKWSGYLPNQVQQMMRRWWKDRGQYATIEALKAGLDVSKIPYLMEQFEHDTGTTTCTDTETDGEELALSEMSDVDADVNRLIQEYEVKSLNSSFESGDFNLSVDNLLKPPSQRQSRNSSFFEESIITEGGTRISKPHFVIDKPQNAEYRHESTV